jgi:hypothetical protein
MVDVVAARPRIPAVQASLARWLTYAGIPLGVAACVAVGSFGFANGGYFPVSWGWGSVALLALAALALAVGVSVELGRLDKVFLTALAGLAAWTALSLLWTSTVPQTVLEVERVLVYVGAGVAGILLSRRASVASLVAGIWVGVLVVSTYALLTRLFPDRLGNFNAIVVYRLSDPVGYWNGLGILAVIGVLLALGLAARSGPLVRCLAAGSTVIFMLTLYFTYSRGSWAALFVGVVVAIAVDRRRLQLATIALVLLPWSAAAIGIASTSAALTHSTSELAAAARDGHGLAVIAIVLVVAASLTILVVDWLAAAWKVPHGLRRAYAGTLLFVLAAVLIAVFGRYGFPPTLARKAYDSFIATQTKGGDDLNSRLFSLSSNGRSDAWHTAWQEASDHPLVGGGAGSYAAFWAQHRRIPATLHDAHNLYLEMLAELGPIGLLALTVLFATPLAALRRARRASPLAAAVVGAFVAFLLHAAVDWDWELPAVTLSALFCGIVLIAAARRERDPGRLRLGLRLPALAGMAALFAFALLGLLGNSAVSASSKSTDGGHYAQAASQARHAMSFLPWSAEPWRRLGEAQAVRGDLAGARASFRKAIAKDSGDWTLWYELALASRGAERRSAFARAARLNPLDTRLRPSSS